MQPVAAGHLRILPAGGQRRSGIQVAILDRAVLHYRADTAIASRTQGVEQAVELVAGKISGSVPECIHRYLQHMFWSHMDSVDRETAQVSTALMRSPDEA